MQFYTAAPTRLITCRAAFLISFFCLAAATVTQASTEIQMDAVILGEERKRKEKKRKEKKRKEGEQLMKYRVGTRIGNECEKIGWQRVH